MLDKRMLIFIVVVLSTIGGLIWWGVQDGKQPVDDPNAIVYYYGEGCSHCKVVNDFLEANPIVKEKVVFEKKEVWGDKRNAKEMLRRAKVCNIASDGVGVPFLYSGDGKCSIGEVEVIDFFKAKSGLNEGVSDTKKEE